jgi:hypothetical protein
MRIQSLLDAKKRRRHLFNLRKRINSIGKSPVPTIPVFILGKQRSGTTMLFSYFESRLDTETFDESDHRAFTDFQIHDFEKVQQILNNSRAPFTVFKPICDSHRVQEFINFFPNSWIIWAQRYFKDVANSSIRHFSPDWDTGLKIICEGRSGGGWFVQGVSEKSAAVLRKVYRESLSPFEKSCLVWWARNQIPIENTFHERKHVIMVQYEDLVTNPGQNFEEINRIIGLPSFPSAYSHVHSRSIGRNSYPDMDEEIEKLCEKLHEELLEMCRSSQMKFLQKESGDQKS